MIPKTLIPLQQVVSLIRAGIFFLAWFAISGSEAWYRYQLIPPQESKLQYTVGTLDLRTEANHEIVTISSPVIPRGYNKLSYQYLIADKHIAAARKAAGQEVEVGWFNVGHNKRQLVVMYKNSKPLLTYSDSRLNALQQLFKSAIAAMCCMLALALLGAVLSGSHKALLLGWAILWLIAATLVNESIWLPLVGYVGYGLLYIGLAPYVRARATLAGISKSEISKL